MEQIKMMMTKERAVVEAGRATMIMERQVQIFGKKTPEQEMGEGLIFFKEILLSFLQITLLS